uniref:hypothetical protein n=1 Tax=Altererythrobacter segetis TaxID=1104773 RepID=UPI001409BF7A|nr:hypothetical protein [Altererythrobacter segetis]
MPRASGQFRIWLALALVPLLSGCLGAVALPLLAGGTLMATDEHRVRAATQVAPPAIAPAATAGAKAEDAILSAKPMPTQLTELPPPSNASATVSDDGWQPFFTYAQARRSPKDAKTIESALLKQPPTIDSPVRLKCAAPVAAVVIDLDEGSQTFDPGGLVPAPARVAEGLAQLRQEGIVVLWITRLPAGRAAEVAQALRASGLDPQGQDQLLLLRNARDRKQLLREDASKDVCVVAIAGDQRGDFDELFDYLRNPGGAVGLYPIMGHGWFLVPSLARPAGSAG